MIRNIIYYFSKKTQVKIYLIATICLFMLSLNVLNLFAQEMNEAGKYFPLQIGNKWVYLHKYLEEQKIGANHEMVLIYQDTLYTEITKTLEYEDETYYHIDNMPYWEEQNDEIFFRNDGNYVYQLSTKPSIGHPNKAYDFALCEYGLGTCEKDYYLMDTDFLSTPRFYRGMTLPAGTFMGYYIPHNWGDVSSLYIDFFIPGIGLAYFSYSIDFDIPECKTNEYLLIGAVIDGKNYGLITGVEDKEISKPSPLKISAHPNPFNPITEIFFTLPKGNYTTLSVFNIQGQKVATLKDSFLSPGNHSITWSASGLSSGIYLIRLKSGNLSSVCRVLLMK